MDATLFDVNLRQSRATCYPSGTDALTYGLATTWAAGQVRAAGIYGGSRFFAHVWSVNGVQGIEASVPVELPLGYFGTVRPPMIFVMAQFGSAVYYKCVRDVKQRFSKHVKVTDTQGQTLYYIDQAPEYQVFVDKLRPDATVVDGTTLFQWKFMASLHCVNTTGRGDRWPWTGMVFGQTFPTFADDYVWARGGLWQYYWEDGKRKARAAEDGTALTGIMHYYAIGVDAW
jgi:hypothetical protein